MACQFKFSLKDETALNTGRPLYRVECVTCGVLLHPGTTGPDHRVNGHLRDVEDGCVKGWLGEAPRPGYVTITPEVLEASKTRPGTYTAIDGFIPNDVHRMSIRCSCGAEFIQETGGAWNHPESECPYTLRWTPIQQGT